MERANAYAESISNDWTGCYVVLMVFVLFVFVYFKLKKARPVTDRELAKIYAACDRDDEQV